ncbi:uncharacterized protein LOC142539445 [Primulina tabacum]|uniref:uncharacterized protein LOC142539445 n=1 Tax=Primulina tabacum TaxID=48773 RepID=UPI003F59C0D6
MAAMDMVFTEEEMAVDQGVGYPRAYAKLCRDRSFGPYSNGPPFTFTPYALVQQEESRIKELEEMFPIIDHQAKPTTKPKIFVSLLWKQLNHLGNAGFDPEIIRVDPYGNVLYYHADPASPLAWEIDHWFPCSRGGLTVPSNLRILQWQVCKGKDNKLEYLIPWWDFQLGISINQFLSIFASSRSDFRNRAFSWLFSEGESEEMNATQTVESHSFPQHFAETKGKLGLAPAAVVLSRRESFDNALKSLDSNRRPRSSTPIIAMRKVKPYGSKENEDPLMVSNPYQAIVTARDSLKQREATAKMQAEIQKLDDEVNELQRKTEEEKASIRDLELVLMKRKRRAEKCRRVAEAQSSHRVMLEKMIRDAMHQSVVYKEQVRLNQAASSALLARLEAQKAICDSAERELHRKYEQRDELEKQLQPEWEQTRKRSRMYEDHDNKIVRFLTGNEPNLPQKETRMNNTFLRKEVEQALRCSPEVKSAATLRKELRKFLEEEQRASEVSSLLGEERRKEELEGTEEIVNDIKILKPYRDNSEENGSKIEEGDDEKLEMLDSGTNLHNIQFPDYHEPKEDEDEEARKLRGKGNIDKWLQFLLEKNATEGDADFDSPHIGKSEFPRTNALVIVPQLVSEKREADISKGGVTETEEARNSMSSRKDKEDMEKDDIFSRNIGDNTLFKNPPYRIEEERNKAKESVSTGKGDVESDEGEENKRKGKKNATESTLSRSDSKRAFRRIPSSPSLILEGMKKRVDCIGKKPSVLDDNDCEYYASARNSFIKSSIKTIKKAVKF